MERRSEEQVDRAALRRILTDHFNDHELRDLCFDLGIDYKILPSHTKEDRARELVAYAERYGRTAELVAQVRQLRPDIQLSKAAPIQHRLAEPNTFNNRPLIIFMAGLAVIVTSIIFLPYLIVFPGGAHQTPTSSPLASLTQLASTSQAGVNQQPTSPPIPSLPPFAATPKPESIEVEYKTQMQFEQSETVRVSLIYIDSLTLTPIVEVPGSIVVRATPQPFGTPGPMKAALGADYQAFVVASLDNGTFDIAPASEKEYPLVGQERLDWQWSVTPNKEGPQVLSLIMEVRWKPRSGGDVITYPVYRKRLPIHVAVPPFKQGDSISLYTTLLNIGSFLAGILATWGAPKLYAKLFPDKKKQPVRRPRKQPQQEGAAGATQAASGASTTGEAAET
jgi:hypothetical protein